MSRFQMSFLIISLLDFAMTNPLPKLVNRAPPETAGPHRRGIAYNEAKFVKYFDVDGSQVTWFVLSSDIIPIIVLNLRRTYNWDSRPNGDTNTWHEYVPMLHSNRPDHTRRWSSDVQAAAFANKDVSTHLLGFNEPDNCQ